MRVLVHICCGPCAITVLRHLPEHGHEPTGFFFNPNIHPLAEYLRRREGAAQVARRLAAPLLLADSLPHAEQVWDDPWLHDRTEAGTAETGGRTDPSGMHAPPYAPGRPPIAHAASPVLWLRAVHGRENQRCVFCWRTRLAHTAATAARLGFDAFTASLLYSRHQDHDRIRALGEQVAATAGVGFYYYDFRRYWQQGIDLSREWSVYRQPYCGCLFSEYERHAKQFGRTLNQTGTENV